MNEEKKKVDTSLRLGDAKRVLKALCDLRGMGQTELIVRGYVSEARRALQQALANDPEDVLPDVRRQIEELQAALDVFDGKQEALPASRSKIDGVRRN